MLFKKALKCMLPYGLIRLREKGKEKLGERSPRLYPSYDAARKDCIQNCYEDKDIVSAVIAKNKIYREKITQTKVFDLGSIRTLIGICLAARSATLNVLDFGGAAGYHYSIAQSIMGDTVALRWNVVETPQMARAARTLEDDRLHFFNTISEAESDLGHVDLVFTSGALQYCPDPLGILKSLLEISARYLFITRVGLNHEDREIITIQKSMLSENGPGELPPEFSDKIVSYPLILAGKPKLEEIIKKKYTITFALEEDKAIYDVGGKAYSMYGYFCESKASAPGS